ncbi:MAG: hypothetical protein EA420_01125 [Candidatus Competibacteraceae bacterium]|jgi:hypothetical protein|nr:MAG: hypothetical protein EA420_01125 [Candidatus Competibacteraceae bacterium]
MSEEQPQVIVDETDDESVVEVMAGLVAVVGTLTERVKVLQERERQTRIEKGRSKTTSRDRLHHLVNDLNKIARGL